MRSRRGAAPHNRRSLLTRADRRLAALTALLALAAACSTSLPDPESAGAQIYQVRCGSCHRVYEPGTLTAAMWEIQLDRMQPEMARRGVNPLTAQERHLIMSYLKAHSSDAPAAQAAAPQPVPNAPAPQPGAAKP